MFHRSRVSPTVHVHEGESSHAGSSSRGGIVKTLLKMGLFLVLALCFMGAHLGMSLYLHGVPVERSGISQSWQGAIGNFLALTGELMLVSGVGVSYDQILWRSFRQSSLSVDMMDRLSTLPSAPWDLTRVGLLFKARLLWVVSLICVCMPLAGMFPPGTMNVEFENTVLDTSIDGALTMNASDWGTGTERSFIEHSLFNMDGALRWMATRPNIEGLALAVLAQGRPIDPPTPCSGACSYDLTMQGPRVHCDEDDSLEAALFEPCQGQTILAYEAVTGMNTRLRVDPSNRGWGNNFTASFHRELRMGPKGTACRKETLTTLKCHLTLATYDVHIRNEENGTSVYETEIVDDQEFWEEEKGTAPLMDYYRFFHNSTGGTDYEEAINQTQLTKEFTITQSFSIGHAALNTLIGNITAFFDGQLVSYETDGPKIINSPYVGMSDPFVTENHLSPETMQQFLEHVLISTISLNSEKEPLWVNQDPVFAMEGGQVFSFQDRLQFFVPYGACLFFTALIYALGIKALFDNGGPAGRNYDHLATAVNTTSPSEEFSDAKGEEARHGSGEKETMIH